MELVKGQKYLLTGLTEYAIENGIEAYVIKFPQTVFYNGRWFLVECKYGVYEFFTGFFKSKPTTKKQPKTKKPATLEIYPYRGGFRYRKIAANGKILNHHYNTKQAASKGADAEQRFWSNYKKVYK